MIILLIEKTHQEMSNGEYDFESIYALDLELFNKDLELLLQGEETEIPSFNFKTGKREWHGNKIKMPENGVIVVEGIHGLMKMPSKRSSPPALPGPRSTCESPLACTPTPTSTSPPGRTTRSSASTSPTATR